MYAIAEPETVSAGLYGIWCDFLKHEVFLSAV